MKTLVENDDGLFLVFNTTIYTCNASYEAGPSRTSHYSKTSSISRTESQSLNVSFILLQLSSLNPLKPGVKLRIKM